MRFATCMLVCSAVLCGCGSDDTSTGSAGPSDPLPPPAEGEGFQLAMEAVAPASSEMWKCLVGTIPTSGFSFVNRVEAVQTQGIHHMDIGTMVFSDTKLPPGLHDCADLYDNNPAIMEDSVIIFASQTANETISLPPGIVAQLPPGIDIIHEIHYVNTSTEDVAVFSKVNAYTIPGGEVTGNIWGGAVRDKNINIPAKSQAVEWTRCVMNADADVLFLASHTHQLARSTAISLYDGSNVGEQIYEALDWVSPELKDFTAEPLHVPAGQGFEFRCDYDNPTDVDVHWGFKASDEMCQIAIVFTPGDSTTECVPVESSDGVLE